ncbi:pseudaminic acid synthase [Curvivirga aplysinae]|uniref:pseudaminic acid synthase n=1 Tax=Curvivirga aplysinae TaxID=2529852 RepID=UPI0012BCC580|nr:pseudaminic acid synthase [Curvivirga aplysinae]MTI09754.1 pseudaminic acid synthase [Curvivirga aplysinae]
MPQIVKINNKKLGASEPVYFIAELSANHNHDFERVIKLVHAAAEAGADAIKLQTYTPDTITIKSDRPEFQVDGTIWEGTDLYSLYQQAYTPWEWHKPIIEEATRLGLDAFSAPFDPTAVDFLEKLDVPIYKIASSELVDIPLLKLVASTNKPVILSTGMAIEEEVEEAVTTLRNHGCKELILLKCTASYPALPEEANLNAIPMMSNKFKCPVGLSDHTLGSAVPITSVALGACVIEKHFTLSRKDGGPDAAFSLEPHEFKEMVEQVKIAQSSLGQAKLEPTKKEQIGLKFRRSLYVIKDARAGDLITSEHIRSIRPAQGLHTRYHDIVIGQKFIKDVVSGTPLDLTMFEKDANS